MIHRLEMFSEQQSESTRTMHSNWSVPRKIAIKVLISEDKLVIITIKQLQNLKAVIDLIKSSVGLLPRYFAVRF